MLLLLNQVDINMYLQKISAAFRRYVLNTLAKLDAADGGGIENTAIDANAMEPPAAAADAARKTPAKIGTTAATTARTPQTARENTPAPSEYSSARSTPLTAHSAATPGTAHASSYQQRLAGYTPSAYAPYQKVRLVYFALCMLGGGLLAEGVMGSAFLCCSLL